MSAVPPGSRRPSRRPLAVRALWAAGAVSAVVVTATACSSTPAPPPAAAPAPGAHGKHKASGVRGTVAAENGTTWTVSTKAGKQVTVTLAPTTTFGTKAAPATAAQFPVGAPRISAPKPGAPA